MTGLAHHHTLYIRCRPSELWAALTEPEQTPRWFLDTRIESSLEVGAPLRGLSHAAVEGVTERSVESLRGRVLACEPARRLVYELAFTDLDAPATELAFELHEAAPGVVRLELVHAGFVDAGPAWQRTRAGWPLILSCLKTWLETGEPLTLRPS
jgi:uncharacterized protein YndB with AHSA1/START domain